MLDSKSAQAVIVNTRSGEVPRVATIGGRGHLLGNSIASADSIGQKP